MTDHKLLSRIAANEVLLNKIILALAERFPELTENFKGACEVWMNAVNDKVAIDVSINEEVPHVILKGEYFYTMLDSVLKTIATATIEKILSGEISLPTWDGSKSVAGLYHIHGDASKILIIPMTTGTLWYYLNTKQIYISADDGMTTAVGRDENYAPMPELLEKLGPLVQYLSVHYKTPSASFMEQVAKALEVPAASDYIPKPLKAVDLQSFLAKQPASVAKPETAADAMSFISNFLTGEMKGDPLPKDITVESLVDLIAGKNKVAPPVQSTPALDAFLNQTVAPPPAVTELNYQIGGDTLFGLCTGLATAMRVNFKITLQHGNTIPDIAVDQIDNISETSGHFLLCGGVPAFVGVLANGWRVVYLFGEASVITIKRPGGEWVVVESSAVVEIPEELHQMISDYAG